MSRIRLSWPMVLGGAATYAGSTYVGYHAYRMYTQPAAAAGIAEPGAQGRLLAEAMAEAMKDKQRSCCAQWDGGAAAAYDAAVGWDEALLGMAARRRAACAHLRGHVLETACGTGRNAAALGAAAAAAHGRIAALTLTDASPHMLERAFARVRRARPPPLPPALPVAFRVLDLCAPFDAVPDPHFDSVLDTFGLCSVPDPAAAVRAMAARCRPGAVLVLLEHGRAAFPLAPGLAALVNAALDKSALAHALRWGCWWNRDIEAIVRSVDAIDVVSVKRYHLGTTVEIVAIKK